MTRDERDSLKILYGQVVFLASIVLYIFSDIFGWHDLRWASMVMATISFAYQLVLNQVINSRSK